MLLTADLHQTDNPRDADRWNLFPWLRTQVKKRGITQVGILGDKTDAKDRHAGKLVNRLVDEVYELAQLCQVIILPGNHDGIDVTKPFFRFMRKLKGSVKFITDPTELAVNGFSSLWLPHTKNYEADWADFKWESYRYIFCHQTFEGAKAENGISLRGIPPSVFNKIKASYCPLEVYSGDVHVPQGIGKRIEYVGAPYRVHFGDTFTPRCLWIKQDGSTQNLYYPGQSRELITAGNVEDVEKHDYVMGTQVKIRIRLRRSDFPDWPDIRRRVQKLAAARGWELHGLELVARKLKEHRGEEAPSQNVDAETALRVYAKRKKADKRMVKQGLEFLDGAKQ